MQNLKAFGPKFANYKAKMSNLKQRFKIEPRQTICQRSSSTCAMSYRKQTRACCKVMKTISVRYWDSSRCGRKMSEESRASTRCCSRRQTGFERSRFSSSLVTLRGALSRWSSRLQGWRRWPMPTFRRFSTEPKYRPIDTKNLSYYLRAWMCFSVSNRLKTFFSSLVSILVLCSNKPGQNFHRLVLGTPATCHRCLSRKQL